MEYLYIVGSMVIVAQAVYLWYLSRRLNSIPKITRNDYYYIASKINDDIVSLRHKEFESVEDCLSTRVKIKTLEKMRHRILQLPWERINDDNCVGRKNLS